jgi:nitroreductase
MLFQRPVSDIISRRYSCRSYRREPIALETRQRLQHLIETIHIGPFGTALRFRLLAASAADRKSLRGLGTYGFIRGATGFIAGAAGPGEKNLEDFGYQMEAIILAATDLGLGTCWLGGSFTQSSFARKIDAAPGEVIPAVTATGYAVERSRYNRVVRQQVGADRRLPWDQLFFAGRFGAALSPENAGPYARPLEMVRLAPSASNKQPWRIVQEGDRWHFYLQRTPNYGRGSLVFNLLRLADLQRVDLGIALCHFELTARELGLEGGWAGVNPGLEPPDEGVAYIASWVK